MTYHVPGNEHWAGRSVLVTGAGGFVGAWLSLGLSQRQAGVVALLRDRKVRSPFSALDLEARVDTVFGEVQDTRLMERVLATYDVKTVFHLAAESLVGVAQRSPINAFDANIRGTWSLLEACRSVGVESIVVASSDKAYGHHEELPYLESSALRPRFTYETSKACADLIAQAYGHTYGMPIGIARCANIYGGADLNWSRIIPGTIRAVLKDQRPVIRSDGTLERDYLYVDDAVRGYLALGSAVAVRPELRAEAFNFGNETLHSVLEIANQILRISGKRHLTPDVQGVGQAVNEIRRQQVGSAKAQRLLGWRALVGLDEGLQQSWEWYRARPVALLGDA